MDKEISLVDKYSNSPYLRSLVSLIPYIGSSIDIVLTDKSAKWKQERLSLILTGFDQNVKNLNLSLEEVSNRIESEEFHDNLIKVLELTIKTRRKEKIKAFSNILTNQILNKLKGTIDSELSILILDSMSIEEINYFSELNNMGGTMRSHILDSKLVDIESLKEHLINGHIEYDRFSGVPDQSLNKLGNQIVWKFLSDKSLITIEKKSNTQQVPYSFGTSNSTTNTFINAQGKIEYRISDFGKEFFRWIKYQ